MAGAVVLLIVNASMSASTRVVNHRPAGWIEGNIPEELTVFARPDIVDCCERSTVWSDWVIKFAVERGWRYCFRTRLPIYD